MKIIGTENKVNYGVFDGPVEFNHKEFQLLDFFGKEISGFRKRFAFKKFNYIGIITDEFLIGFAAVSLGYVYNGLLICIITKMEFYLSLIPKV
ncbi:DUF2804 domain-containing protein [Leptospira noguchii]|nr:DUF2804 family protein [Leptospira noguchii]EMI69489.1 PF10974 domain protein [Leptospira noguchii str. Bonito]EMS90027.1 PF10974 domain protein [Leptospira noguchii str. Cascata]UOG38312.1 DUF2804 domain-containing protein [Leptospira noguchii]